jgi:hypothetical protein
MKSVYKLTRLCLPCLVAVALMLAAGSVARADSLDFGNGLTADGYLTTGAGNTFTLNFTIYNFNSTDAGIYDFSVQLTGGNGSVSVDSYSGTGTSVTGFEFFTDTKQNNGSGVVCNETSNSGWLCVDYSSGFAVIPGEGTLAYTFSGTYTGTPVAVLELMAQGCDTTNGTDCVYNGAGSFNISAPMDGPPVPEPGSLLLFGTGLIGMAGFLRRKLTS